MIGEMNVRRHFGFVGRDAHVGLVDSRRFGLLWFGMLPCIGIGGIPVDAVEYGLLAETRNASTPRRNAIEQFAVMSLNDDLEE